MRYREPKNNWDVQFEEDYKQNLEDIERDISGVEFSSTQAKTIADMAKSASENALSKVTNVEKNATEANTTAQNAINTANAAKTTADVAKTKADSVQAQLTDIIIESGTSDAETIASRTDVKGTTFNSVPERLNAEQTNFLIASQEKNNVRLFGAVPDGVTPCDTAVNNAKNTGNKRIYFPQNETNNAVYYFSSNPVFDGFIVYADKGVKLSVPTTNNISFKNGLFMNDVSVTSRDRDNTGEILVNNISKSLPLSFLDNEINLGMKKPVMVADAEIGRKIYNLDSTPSLSTLDIIFYEPARLLYKVKTANETTNANRLQTLEVTPENGYMYSCLVLTLAPEPSDTVRFGVMYIKDNDNFLFYSIDRNGNLYTGIKENGTYTETMKSNVNNVLTDAYTLKGTFIMATRIINDKTIEIYLNGALMDTVTLNFSCVKLGFSQNTVSASGTGIYNVVWGSLVKSKANIGRVINDLPICSFGDSITFGEGSISYAEWLPMILEGRRGIKKVTVTNKAVSGQRVSQQLSIMQAMDLTPFKIITIMIGTNDIQGSTTAASFGASLQSMIDLAKGNGRIVIIGIPPMYISKTLTNSGFSSSNYEKGGEIRAKVLELCAKNGVILADTMSEIGRIGLDNHSDVLRDNLHPKSKGEILLAREFARSILYALVNDVPSSAGTIAYDTIKTATLQNSWVDHSTSFSTVRYYKTVDGVVRLKGLIKGGTTTSNTVIFNLPEGYRPTQKVMLPTASMDANSVFSPCTLQVNENGDVVCSANVKNVWLTLELSFKL